MATLSDTLSDTAAFGDATNAGLGGSVGDLFRPTDNVAAIRAVRPTVAETIGTADVAAFLAGYTIFENLSLVDRALPGISYHLSLVDVAAVRDALQRALPLALAESLTLDAAVIGTLSLRVAERLGLVDSMLPSLLYSQSVSEQIRVLTSLANFFGAEAADTLDLADFSAGPAYKVGIISEAAQIAEAVTPRFLLRVVVNDHVQVADADLVRMIFNGWLGEDVAVTAALMFPGALTTWAMNTRTAAVTEYRNYAFNSFGRIGNKYLGASENGLYELLGADDAGADIIATIRSGFAQWAGAHLHSFKAAYLAVRGTGEFILRLITADGRTFNYTVSQDTMRTTKVNMGKGLRARYFAFELVTSGQDFDLESLEFIPLAAQRRV